MDIIINVLCAACGAVAAVVTYILIRRILLKGQKEEIIRKAAEHTDKQITKYQEKYPETPLVKVLSMVALNMAVENVTFSKRLQEYVQNDEKLAKELENYLDNIDKNSR